jgi:uncharacterized membrane protein YedE/YeeE
MRALKTGRQRVLALVLGMALGFSLSRIGFTDYGELHRMFTFGDLRLVMVFGLGVVLTGIAFRFIPAARALPPRPVQRSAVVGGLLFGAGWVLCGACPGAALAQLGEGKLFALVTLSGIAAGMRAFGPLNGWLRGETGTCE